MIKNCIVCGREFNSPPSADKVTCSMECQKKRRSQLLKGHEVSDKTKAKISKAAKERGHTENLSKGTPAAMKSPKGGRFETNSSAKDWTIMAPSGNIYTITNLKNWIRQNPEKFGDDLSEADIDRISSGFRVVARNARKGKSGTTYKGWSVLYTGLKNIEKENKNGD